MAGIAELMVRSVVTATPFENVAEVTKRMTDKGVGAVLVVENGVLSGLFTERDLLNKVVSAGRDPHVVDVGTVATRDPVTVEVGAPLRAVLHVFRQKKFRHLPVVDGGKPVGILSTRDFLDYLLEGLERYIDEMKYSSELATGVDPYDHVGGSYGR